MDRFTVRPRALPAVLRWRLRRFKAFLSVGSVAACSGGQLESFMSELQVTPLHSELRRPCSRGRRLPARLLLGAVAIAACHDIGLTTPDITCESAEDCREPYVCQEGRCREPCLSPTACDGGVGGLGATAGASVLPVSGGSGSNAGDRAGMGGALSARAGAGGSGVSAAAGTGTGGSLEYGGTGGFLARGGDTGTSGSSSAEGGAAGTSGGSSAEGGASGEQAGGQSSGGGGRAPGNSGTGGNAGVAGDGEVGEPEVVPCEGTLAYEELPLITVPRFPGSMVVTDVDGDNREDIVVASTEPRVISVLPGLGGGYFGSGTPYSASAGIRTVSVGDVNGDRAPDLVFATEVANIGVQLNEGDGTFARAIYYPVGTSTAHVGLADLDRDDDVDLIVGNWSSPELFVLLNEGEGTFAEGIGYNVGTGVGYRVLVGNLNADEYPDFILFGGGQINVTINSGTGNYAPTGATSALGVVNDGALADFDEDGHLDLATSPRDGQLTIFSGDGAGTFTYETDYAWATYDDVATADFDGDGNIDLVATTPYYADAQIMLNRFPDRKFSDFITIPGQHSPIAVQVSDLDRNGLPDLVMSYPNHDAIGVRLAHCNLED